MGNYESCIIKKGSFDSSARDGDPKLDFRSLGMLCGWEWAGANSIVVKSVKQIFRERGRDDKTIYSFPGAKPKNEKTAIGTLHNFSGGVAAITPKARPVVDKV